MMKLEVRSKSRHYPVWIGEQLLERCAEYWPSGEKKPGKIVVVTDHHVVSTRKTQIFLETLQQMAETHLLTVTAGEASKSLETAETIYSKLAQLQIRREDMLVAWGGGVVGDLTGFVAATYLRGLRYIQAPTTLLAHDSSLGGKVGVNLKYAKNLVGSFYSPVAIWYDVEMLESLSQRDWASGMAEVIKHAIIGSEKLFTELYQSPYRSYPGGSASITMLSQAMQVKIDVVEADEQEAEWRMVLNAGHTIGHAVEAKSEYRWSHGEAISIGLAVESYLAKRLGLLSEDDKQKIIECLELHGLPTQDKGMAFDELIPYLQLDKKNSQDGWTFALPERIGQVRIIKNIDKDLVRLAWQDNESR
ncbi:3-dehydroquinate synthase [Alicyclobacillus sp. TC]|uniref:3-dehydroquinate synthase n=1 Tax=Alicyclobacillus sp. TC TaxID=2606450 RepID=UPI0019335EBC|nr:3-dehydroquinate synthase [Alicyclobacillus sp. TC]QRF23362.1 3-dehydroquinate synthase [Alicyclobacillus sp. TC]